MTERARLIQFSAIFLANLALVGLVLATVFAFPESYYRLRDVRKLERVLPVLVQYKVQVFQKFSEYHTLYYTRGQFCSREDEDCIINLGQAQPFDEHAERDFAAIEAALSDAGIGVDSIEAHFSTSGDVLYAEFGLTCMLCGSDRYAYSPNGAYLPDEVPNNLWHPRVNEVWYLIQESWH